MIINAIFGTVLALSYQHYQISGLAFNSVLLIPSYTVFLIALIISSTSILKYSLFQFNCLVKNNSAKLAVEFHSMLKKQLMVLIILIPNAVLEVLLNNLFIKTFKFT